MRSAELPSPVIRLAVRAPADAAEAVLAALLDLAPAGLEQVDGEGWVEFGLYREPGELPDLPVGMSRFGGADVTVRSEAVDPDWSRRWRDFHRPVLVGKRVWVRPPWEPRHPRADVLDLVIDPGQAFGTGAHPTTRLCLELMLDLAPGRSLADLGCGSGVLAIAAARLGFVPVSAFDHDAPALAATRDNAAANGVRLDHVAGLDLLHEAPPSADVVVANLMRPLLLHVAARMATRPQALVVSGLLDHEADEVSAAFAPLAERRRASRDGWSAVLLTGAPLA